MQATNATAIGVTGSDALQVSKKGDSNEWQDTGPTCDRHTGRPDGPRGAGRGRVIGARRRNHPGAAAEHLGQIHLERDT